MISCPKCHRVSQAFDRGLAISQLSDDCDEQGCPATDGNVVTEMAAVDAPSKYRVCGMEHALPLYEEAWVTSAPRWGDSFDQHTQHLIPIGAAPEVVERARWETTYRVSPAPQRLIDDPCPMPGWERLAGAELQSRIRGLQEQNERLAALVDEKEKTAERLLSALTNAAMLSLPSPAVVSRAPDVRWVALSSGWHHWPCVTTGAKAPEREAHPLHRAIAVRKEPFPR